MTTGWRKKQIMMEQQVQMEKRDPLEVVKIVVEALDDAYAAGVRNSKREWVGLTPQERDEINEQVYGAVPHHVAFHHAIEVKLKEKNTQQDTDCKYCTNGCAACDARKVTNVLP